MASKDAPSEPSAAGSLTADQIERQGFSRARKGFDENQVREFLRQVADEHEALSVRIAELEEKLRHPSVPSEQQLVDLVGEEVARTLHSAQESADDVMNRARVRARRIEHQAAEDAQRLRAEQLEQSTQDARAIVEAARERGREMVAEARLLRERVITDLNHRRDMLRAYIEQLRADRDRFANTYKAVHRTVSNAHEELVRFESGQPFPPVPVESGPTTSPSESAPSERLPERERRPPETSPATGIGLGELPGRREPVPPLAPRSRKPEPKVMPEPKAAPKPETTPEPKAEPVPEPKAEPKPAPEPEGKPEAMPIPALELELESEAAEPVLDLGPEPARELERDLADALPETESEVGTDVDALFQRIRADRDETGSPSAGGGGAEGTASPASLSPATATEAISEPESDNDTELLVNRDDVLTPVAEDLLRRCKRVLQDEQNDVLDALRRHRGRVTADKLLPPVADQVAAWAEVMTPAIDQAYVAGCASAGSSSSGSPVFSAPRRIVTGLVEVVVTPLRDRLLNAIEQTLADDPNAEADAIAQRIGARYREWRGQELDGRIGDVLAAAYARGIYDGTPEGSRLRWVPAEPGQCPDAEDNALEPTPRGERFPTGQQFPPAHPGCRCLLAVIQER
jgi:DivIVA domain-containing protein